MRSISLLALCLTLVSSNAFASELDGSWSLVSTQCGSAPAEPAPFPVSLMIQGEQISIAMDVSVAIPGCTVVGNGRVQVSGNSVFVTGVTMQKAPACGDADITANDSVGTFDVSPTTLNVYTTTDSSCPGQVKKDVYSRQ